jgi:hypothetical protein
MRPVLRSLLAELSPNWLTAARLRRGAAAKAEAAVAPSRPPLPSAVAEPRRQQPRYKPAHPRKDDIASNM